MAMKIHVVVSVDMTACSDALG